MKIITIVMGFFACGFGIMFAVWIATLVYFGFNLNALANFVDSQTWQGLIRFFIGGLAISSTGSLVYVAVRDSNAEQKMFQTRSSKDTAHEKIDVHAEK